MGILLAGIQAKYLDILLKRTQVKKPHIIFQTKKPVPKPDNPRHNPLKKPAIDRIQQEIKLSLYHWCVNI